MKNKINLVNENCTIKNAIKILEYSPKKIICLTNKKNQMIGTITDGDIRRSILNGVDENEKISKIANKKPFVLKYDNKISFENVRKIFFKKKINAIPVLKNKKIIKLLYIDDYLYNTLNFDTEVVIPCGGYGKRLHPLTKKVPKCLIKIKKNKTILDLILEKFLNKNFKNFYFLTFYKKKMIKDHVKKNYDKSVMNNIFIEEKKPLGTAGGLSLLNLDKLNKNILVINSDIITQIDFDDLLQFHKKNKSQFTLVTHSIIQKFEYGSIKNDSENFASISEKPYTRHFVNAGIYLLDKECLKLIKKNQYLDMNDFITLLKKYKYKIKLYHSFEKWIDVGTLKKLKNAKKIKYY